MALQYGFFHIYHYSKQNPFTYHRGDTGIDPVYPSHMHSHIEIIRVIEGSGHCRCDDREYDIAEGDIVVFNSYTIHSIYSDTKMVFHCFIIDSIFCCDNGINVSNIQFNELIKDENLNKLFDDTVIQVHFHNSSPCHETRIKISLLYLLVNLRENYTYTLCSNQNALTPAMFQTKNAMQYVMSNWQKKITINDVVSFVNVSPAHLSRNFKMITGKTIVEFINATKCDMAQNLLANGMSVAEVANMCSFDTPSYFAKIFKKYIGVSPRSYASLHNEST